MKKIICLFGLFGLMQNVFAKWYPHSSYFNYTQNVTASCAGCAISVIANLGDSVVFEAYVEEMGGYTYPDCWYFNGDTIPNTMGQQYLTVIINQSGTYFAFVGSYLIGMNFYVNNITGLPSVKNINFFNAFPTAVTSSITIQLNSIKTNDVVISFFDMNGRELKNNFYKNVFGEFIKNENTEVLAKGIYFIRIKAGEEILNKKFVKM